jgi:hypothetical protein
MIYTKFILSLTNYLQFLIVWIFKSIYKNNIKDKHFVKFF